MTRIVKEPEIRKGEITNTAQRLFYQKGYDNTTVNDIIQSSGIAKGTFYYYFRSKIDVIDEIIEKYTSQIADEITLIVEDDLFSPIEKLNEFFLSAGFLKPNNRMVTTILVKLIFMAENTPIKEKMTKNYIKLVTPLLSQIISQFPTYREEAGEKITYIAEFLLLAYLNLSEDLSIMLLDKTLNNNERELITGKSAAYAEAAEKILDTGINSIYIMKDELINKYFDIFSRL